VCYHACIFDQQEVGRMKTIGVLGGLGPQATMDFEALVHAVSEQIIPRMANTGYPPMAVYYYRHAPVLTDDNFRPIFPLQPDPRLLDAAAKLGTMADFLVITSNGVHMMQPLIEQASGRKVLSIIDVTLAEVKRRGLRRVGAITYARPDVYRVPLEAMGLQCVTIPADVQQRLDAAIMAFQSGLHRAEEYEAALDAVNIVRAEGADGTILGCTELPLMLRPVAGEANRTDEAEASDLIDPAQLLAEAAVRYAIA
jgi:aspartate racemase